jgi:hypothetical protein
VGLQFDNLLLLDFYKCHRVTSTPLTNSPPIDLRVGEYIIQIQEWGVLKYYRVLERAKPIITRLKLYPPSIGELFFLRAILQYKAGWLWKDLYTIDGIIYPTFQAIAIALGLFPKDGEAHYTLAKAIEVSYTLV